VPVFSGADDCARHFEFAPGGQPNEGVILSLADSHNTRHAMQFCCQVSFSGMAEHTVKGIGSTALVCAC
jgi:hypothetical protein